VAHTERSLVCVDANPVAVRYTEANARTAGLGSQVKTRLGRITDVLRADETFPMVIADPPWVVSAETRRFPEDPLLAIDGGTNGLVVARECWDAIDQHLGDCGAALLQLGCVEQVTALVSLGSGSLRCREVRQFRGGVVVHLVRTHDERA
jgi:release factor glutamine methyltransferase